MTDPKPHPPGGESPGVEHPVIAHVGGTPLWRLERIGNEHPHVALYVKAEWYNPGGSVKDRAALNIIREGERSGLLTPEKVILDATSGNTGIAYAMIAAARGYRVKIVLPENASVERKRILRAYGAELVFTPSGDGTDGSILKAREIYASDPERYYYPDQYSNQANWKAHYEGTAAEIWEQTGGRVTHFVATLGTSGTFVGTSRRLKEWNRRIRCISVEPDEAFHGLEGMKHMESAMVPEIYDPTLADVTMSVSTEDAYRMVRTLARREGLLVGVSSGAGMCAALRVARDVPAGEEALVVTIFPDNAEKYLSERFWDEEDE